MKITYKIKLKTKIMNLKGVWFHIVGIVCLIWFLIRVGPAPQRSAYPCQQIAIPIALGYIAFWSVMFYGLLKWIKRAKVKTAAFAPAIPVSIILIFTISGMVFAEQYSPTISEASPWNPIPKIPIGLPQGVTPGRVVWVWNPNATASDLTGFWWTKYNNNQSVIDQMFSIGIQGLAGVTDDFIAWENIFKFFNKAHGSDEIGYQSGEKIAIKINLNNCWDYYGNSYTKIDNQRDANPYVVKALLRQLVNTVGVNQSDITLYDASRKMGNWFYRRVYYENYPALNLIPEFANIQYVDSAGEAPGRQKVEASSQRIYFADGTGLYRTLPKCVVDAKYIINMPILKRHPIENGVTLSGKNLFGTFIEPVIALHDYHRAGFSDDHPAPQVDLLAHDQIGGKTVLYIGDGIYGTKEDHETIAKFQMYPFNNDWTNSLFFSQDPVAIDSVMYDFLHAEGTNPCEGAQNYLHQAAVPQSGVYDPENDGTYLNTSLGVHEHWDASVDIFSSERYSGPSENGIEFIAYGQHYASDAIVITKPRENHLYLIGQEISPLPVTVIIGKIPIEVMLNGMVDNIEKIEIFIDNTLQFTDYEAPYIWEWNKPAFFRHTINAIAYYNSGNSVHCEITVWKFF